VCGDAEQCSEPQCDGLGVCVPDVPINEGDPCDDGDQCTEDETCVEGECTGGTVIPNCPGFLIFVTSTLHEGNFGFGVSGGGLAFADDQCQFLADQQSLGGSWVAILSDEDTNASDDSRIPDNTGPFYLVGFLGDPLGLVADDKADLFDGDGVQTDININEKGLDESAGLTNEVWTATNAFGIRTNGVDQNCEDWQSNANNDKAITGSHNQNDARYIIASPGGTNCSQPLHFYCIQVGL